MARTQRRSSYHPSNQEVAALLQEYADLLAITGGDSFRIRAYERAARAIEEHGTDVAGLDAKHLQKIHGVGGSIADKIKEFARTGKVAAIEEARSRVPEDVREMTAIPALGPRKAQSLFEELGVSSVEELAEAAQAHRLQGLKGFGPKIEENILRGIPIMQAAGGRAPQLVHMRYGVSTAQRGWLTPDDVINIWPPRRLKAFLRRTR
jgi:DNA polymerase (family 10)